MRKVAKIRWATKTDVKSYLDMDFPQSMRAIAFTLDGEVAGVFGILHTSPLQAFGNIDDELLNYPVVICKSISMLKKMAKNYRATIYAIANPDYKSSERFLKYLGFEFYNTTSQGRIYTRGSV